MDGLRAISKKLDAVYLGVVESVNEDVVHKSKSLFTYSHDVKSMILEFPTHFSSSYSFLAGGQSGILELYFTAAEINGKSVTEIKNIRAEEVLDASVQQHQRVIFECSIEGFSGTFALKCIQTKLKELTIKDASTLIEIESNAYHNVKPFKDLFAEKYAHGRLWFDEYRSCEVILMQKFQMTLGEKLLKEPSQRSIIYLVNALQLLRKLHGVGFAHGDCHGGNVMWTDSTFNNMKFIDPERIERMEDFPPYRKNLLLMYDLYMLLLFSNPILNKIMDKPTSHVVNNLDKVHQRFITIKKHYPSFLLDGLILYDFEFAGNMDKPALSERIIPKYKNEIATLEQQDFDSFFSKLMDVRNMETFIRYMALQILKADTNPTDFDTADIGSEIFHSNNIVVSNDTRQHTEQPRQHTEQPVKVSQRPVAPIAPITTTITPLTLHGAQVCDARGSPVYYNIEKGRAIIYGLGSGVLVPLDFSNNRGYYCFTIQNGNFARTGYMGFWVTYRVDARTNYLELETQISQGRFEHYMTFDLNTTPPTHIA
jgi:hypothetical protein